MKTFHSQCLFVKDFPARSCYIFIGKNRFRFFSNNHLNIFILIIINNG